MNRTRLARTLGLDGNPLRRSTDKIAVGLAALLVAAFMTGVPLLSLAAIGWASHAGAANGQAGRSWRQVPALLLRAEPRYGTGRILGCTWPLARWTAPDGRPRMGRIPVATGLAAGRTVRLWVDAAGWPVSPPSSHRAVVALEATAAVAAPAALGIILVGLAWVGRWVLDRRRLAAWEAAWAAVGPGWTKRFQSRG